MATRPAGQPSPPSVIDLTAIDNEDDYPNQARSTQDPSTIATQLLQDLPPSNHGLILPGTFDFDARPQFKRNIQNGNSGTALPTYPAAKAHGISRRAIIRDSSDMAMIGTDWRGKHTKYSTEDNNNTTKSQTNNRQSTDQSFSRTAGLATDRHIQVMENAAKRRKTHGGIVLQESHIAVPSILSAKPRKLPAAETQRPSSFTPAATLPPVHNKVSSLPKSQFNRARKSSEGHTQSPVHPPILPTHRQDTLAQARQLSSVTKPVTNPVTRRRVSLAERVQADKSTVSLDGRIQKPRNLSQRAASVVPNDHEEQIQHVLRNQVFNHIESAVDQYRLSLSRDDRSSIGPKVAERLAKHPSFIKNLRSNELKLSREYERRLSFKAKTYVDRYASKILNGVALGSGDAFKDPNTTFEDSPTPDRPSNRIEILMTSSSSSDAEEEVFENLPDMRSASPPSSRTVRHYSSSPTTSFSNDVNNGTSTMDVDSHDDSKEGDTLKIKQASRQLRRSSRHPMREKMQAMDIDLPKQASNQKQERRPDLDAIRQIQSLRLTGADKSTPRPYLSFKDREDIRRGCEMTNKYPGRFLSRADQDLLQKSVCHVDFCVEELEDICKVIQTVRKDAVPLVADLRSQVIGLMSHQESIIPSVISAFTNVVNIPGKGLARSLLQRREAAAIDAFLHDTVEGKIACEPQVSRIKATPRRKKVPAPAPARPLISSLLRQREIYGMVPFRVLRGQQSLNVEISSHLEDSLVRKSEWTDCCGDISTVCWTGKDTFICGATAHSDYHNMQYNKPGNLVVGSTSLDTLRAVSNHRVRRPVVGREENAENALESMRQTQDPWLYTSVVSTSHSDYSEISGFAFSASFDHTVKVWKASPDGSLDLLGAWYHDGKVNFVVTSDHHERVATASDVCSNAIRVYNFDEEDITDTPYDTYCGEKAREQALEIKRRDTWAYFPATIQWGKAPGVVDFLLVGYSPRSVTAHEIDIPEDKKNSGELCLWNVELGTKIPISSARTQNVFEVMWHPTQPCFLAATSPCGNFEPETKTQIRLFAQNECGSFLHIKSLDCPAFDINELTIMPNSSIQCYVTASCTDGNTYVWDTAQGDDPIHTLGHGESLDNPIHDLPREIADTGVKFASWGKTKDRFYTGSSDGKVKAWDIRKPKGHAFVRTVLSVSGGVSAGAFSKNYSKLLIGDATGKVHLLEVDDSDPNDSVPTKTPRGSGLPEKRPKVIIPHPQPDPPPGFEREENQLTAQEMASQYIEEGHLRMHSDPGIGAVQGPNYAETLLYCYEAHEGGDGTLPLLPEWQAKQRYEVQSREEDLKLHRLPRIQSSNRSLHAQNLSLDFEFSRLSLATRQKLIRDRVDLDFEPQQKFDFELLPRSEVFKERKARQKRTHNI